MTLDSQNGIGHLRDNSSQEKEAKDLLISFGHLKEGEQLSGHLTAALRRKVISVSDIRSMCTKIEESRTTHCELDQLTLIGAINYGLKDLSHVNLTKKPIIHSEMQGYKLNGANLIYSNCRDTDFNGSMLEGAHLDRTDFTGSHLQGIMVSSICIRGMSIDLMNGAIKINDEDSWDTDAHATESVGNCDNCEIYNRAVLSMEPDTARHEVSPPDGTETLARRGVILFERQKPVGFIKLEGDKSFLAMRTVRNIEGKTIFWKGMVYALDYDLRRYVVDASLPYGNVREKWPRADIEVVTHHFRKHEPNRKFGIDNIRFINDPEIYSRLNELREAIEEGREECQDILL